MTRSGRGRERRSFAQLVRGNRVLGACGATLREASRDGARGQELSGLDVPAVNMDAVKTQWLNRCGCTDHVLKSSDALLTVGDTVYLIEFKAGAQRNVKAREVREKLVGSLLVLSDLTRWTCARMRPHIEYVYVRSSRTGIRDHMRRKAGTADGPGGQEEACGFLYQAEGALFRKAHVLSGTEFDTFIKRAMIPCRPHRRR